MKRRKSLYFRSINLLLITLLNIFLLSGCTSDNNLIGLWICYYGETSSNINPEKTPFLPDAMLEISSDGKVVFYNGKRKEGIWQHYNDKYLFIFESKDTITARYFDDILTLNIQNEETGLLKYQSKRINIHNTKMQNTEEFMKRELSLKDNNTNITFYFQDTNTVYIDNNNSVTIGTYHHYYFEGINYFRIDDYQTLDIINLYCIDNSCKKWLIFKYMPNNNPLLSYSYSISDGLVSIDTIILLNMKKKIIGNWKSNNFYPDIFLDKDSLSEIAMNINFKDSFFSIRYYGNKNGILFKEEYYHGKWEMGHSPNFILLEYDYNSNYFNNKLLNIYFEEDTMFTDMQLYEISRKTTLSVKTRIPFTKQN